VVEGLSILIFVSIALVTVLVALRLGRFRARAVDRLAPQTAGPASASPSSSLVWRELVGRIGSYVPASDRDLPALKRRLIRAGFRHPAAARYFRGARAVLALLLGAGVLGAGWLTGVFGENLPISAGAAAWVGFMLPSQYLAGRIRRRKHAVARGLPNALDLMVVCVESGLGLDQTILQVARELQSAHGEICDEFAVMNLEMRAGKSRSEALHNLADRTAVDDLRKLVAVLVQTDRFGTSIAQTLRGHADYMRTMARQRAEEQAAKLPVKLVFPIFFCVLPTLFVVTLGPVITQLIRDIVPMIENM
jgi:tight adherence protein C